MQQVSNLFLKMSRLFFIALNTELKYPLSGRIESKSLDLLEENNSAEIYNI